MGMDRTDEKMVELIDTRIQLNLEIDKEEVFWKQRARINWLRLGDKNTTFFLRQALTRRNINLIHRLKREDGTEANNKEDIEDTMANFFQQLFSSNGIRDLTHILSGIDNVITPKVNCFLCPVLRRRRFFVF